MECVIIFFFHYETEMSSVYFTNEGCVHREKMQFKVSWEEIQVLFFEMWMENTTSQHYECGEQWKTTYGDRNGTKLGDKGRRPSVNERKIRKLLDGLYH